MKDLVLWNRDTETIHPYPRIDDKPVEGLKTPPLYVLEIVSPPEPEYDPGISSVETKCKADLVLGKLFCEWVITELPTISETQPKASRVGQEWVSLSGELWRVVQGRDQQGKFLPDSPETENKESLVWSRVK
jgi:hypothetical protein